jgi:hypothetical protein
MRPRISSSFTRDTFFRSSDGVEVQGRPKQAAILLLSFILSKCKREQERETKTDTDEENRRQKKQETNREKEEQKETNIKKKIHMESKTYRER